MKTAYIGMSANPPHEGHLKLIERVERLGFVPIIVLNSDLFIKEYKGIEPIMSFMERATYFYNWGYLLVTQVNKEGQRGLIEVYKPDVIVVGTDWMKPEILPQLGIDEQFLQDNDIGMLFLPRTPGISSTQLREEK